MIVQGTNEEMAIHLHLLHESGNRASILLTDSQIKEVTDFINETGKLFSERQEGLNVKFWITGSIKGNDKRSLESEKYDNLSQQQKQ